MAVTAFFWKVWLRLNLLTKDVLNDYIASVLVMGKKAFRPADITRLIIEERSEYQPETVLNILNLRDRVVRKKLQEGYSVLDGVCQITTKVTGTWIGANAKFDPALHKIALSMVPSAEMRAALKEVGVETLGVKADGAFAGDERQNYHAAGTSIHMSRVWTYTCRAYGRTLAMCMDVRLPCVWTYACRVYGQSLIINH